MGIKNVKGLFKALFALFVKETFICLWRRQRVFFLFFFWSVVEGNPKPVSKYRPVGLCILDVLLIACWT